MLTLDNQIGEFYTDYDLKYRPWKLKYDLANQHKGPGRLVVELFEQKENLSNATAIINVEDGGEWTWYVQRSTARNFTRVSQPKSARQVDALRAKLKRDGYLRINKCEAMYAASNVGVAQPNLSARGDPWIKMV